MPVTSVQKYQSSDGRLHDSFAAAEKHDAMSLVMTSTRKFFRNLGVMDGAVFPLDLCNKPELANTLKQLMDSVLNYHQQFGTWKPAGPKIPEVTATMLPTAKLDTPPVPALKVTEVKLSIAPPQKVLSLPAKADSVMVQERVPVGKVVKKYDSNGKLLGIYPSVIDAARTVTSSASAIGKAARGVQKTAAGYIWKYEESSPIAV